MTPQRYSREELDGFRANILKKLERAKDDFAYLQEQLEELSLNSDNDHAADYIDGSAANMDMERMNEMAKRQLITIEELEAALVRIRQGIYGICSVTGERIDPARLKVVPQAMRSVEGEELVRLGKAKDMDLV